MTTIVFHASRCTLLTLVAVLPLRPLTAQQSQNPDSTATPRPLDAVVVSATRSEKRIESLPSPVYVIGPREIATTSAASTPDLLRKIPGFALRDFQTGLISGPSQSMLTFRGLGGSSAGRALVLLDGVPVGDPFSGWLDWGRIPLPILASAEVIQGGGSIIWGSRALGGVVNLRTIEPQKTRLTALAEGGSFGTAHGSVASSLKRGKLAGVLAADFVDTDGFTLTPPDQAGPVDEPKSVRNRVFTGKLTYDASRAIQTWVSGSTFMGGERPWGLRDYLRFNEGRAGIRWLSQSRGIITASAFSNARFSGTKSFSINSDRTSESPQRYGRSPAKSNGIFMQWTQPLRERHELSSGLDFTSASGSFSERYAFAGGVPTQQRTTGGTQNFAGVFIQDAAELGHNVRMVVSARLDRVQSSDGERTVQRLTDQAVLSDSSIADHSDTRLTWSIGFRRQQSRSIGLRINAYEAFRAPSMYEMYYPRFSSKGTVTEANAQLDAERLRGLEGGMDVAIGSGLLARATVFTNRVASPIMDITIGTAGSTAEVIPPCGLMPARQTCTQRRNVNGLTSNGIESDLSWRPSRIWQLSAAYAFNSTRVRAAGQPVDGKRALRSAPHSASASILFEVPRLFSATAEIRHVSSRFEDDLNTIELDPFTIVGLRVNREIGQSVSAYVRIENLLDEEFAISMTRSGLIERGAPRWITAGLRSTW